jgi:hypothetical protein
MRCKTAAIFRFDRRSWPMLASISARLPIVTVLSTQHLFDSTSPNVSAGNIFFKGDLFPSVLRFDFIFHRHMLFFPSTYFLVFCESVTLLAMWHVAQPIQVVPHHNQRSTRPTKRLKWAIPPEFDARRPETLNHGLAGASAFLAARCEATPSTTAMERCPSRLPRSPTPASTSAQRRIHMALPMRLPLVSMSMNVSFSPTARSTVHIHYMCTYLSDSHIRTVEPG